MDLIALAVDDQTFEQICLLRIEVLNNRILDVYDPLLRERNKMLDELRRHENILPQEA